MRAVKQCNTHLSFNHSEMNSARPLEWKPRQGLVANAWVGMIIILVIEINVELFRVPNGDKASTSGAWSLSIEMVRWHH